MDPLQFFAASRLVIVAGKGGVGKTTVTAVLARAAAHCGLRVLVIDVEGRPGLANMLGAPPDDVFTYDARLVAEGLGTEGTGSVCGRLLGPGPALREYLADHGFGRLSGRLAATGVLDVVSTAAPGIEDILVLGKVKQLERAGDYDLILLDAPAAGHAITFLQAASGLLDSVRVGPIHTQARDVLELLSDPARCRVVLVTLAEPTPVNELVETAFALEDRVGIALGPVVVNGLYPPRELPDDLEGDLLDAARFRRARVEAQAAQLAGLGERLGLPLLPLPFVFTAGLSCDDVTGLAATLLGGIAGLSAAAAGPG